jgi:hypothetical protein
MLNIGQDEYISTGNNAAGARLVVHDQHAMPYPEDVGLLVKTGMLTSVHVSRVNTLHIIIIIIITFICTNIEYNDI